MKINVKNRELKELLKFQEGGEMPAETQAEAPAPELAASPEELILLAAALAVLTNDAQLALQVCQALVEMAGGNMAAPAAPEGEPVYRKGGQLKYWKK